MTYEPCPGTPHRGHVHRAEPCPLGAGVRRGTAPATADRPRYRVLANPWYDHDPADHAYGGRHDDEACAAGYELTVYRVDAAWRATSPRYADAPLGVARTSSGGTLDVPEARALVVAWLAARSAPLPCRATPADVELYAPVPYRGPA